MSARHHLACLQMPCLHMTLGSTEPLGGTVECLTFYQRQGTALYRDGSNNFMTAAFVRVPLIRRGQTC